MLTKLTLRRVIRRLSDRLRQAFWQIAGKAENRLLTRAALIAITRL
jgi:hypothetical protein